MQHNKPITLLREDFVNNVIDLCNNSGLPFFVVEDVLQGVIKEVHAAAIQQLEADRQKYKEQLKQ